MTDAGLGGVTMRSAHDDYTRTDDVLAVPTEADIREQFDRIRMSPEFQAPGRGRSFLAYVIEETLAGRGSQLKAYSIAIEVFGRDSSFDAQSDPVVRIEAGRIRRALERYTTSLQAGPIRLSSRYQRAAMSLSLRASCLRPLRLPPPQRPGVRRGYPKVAVRDSMTAGSGLLWRRWRCLR